MSITSKTVLGVVVIAVVLLVGTYAYSMYVHKEQMAQDSNNGLTTSASDTSDAALQSDTETIDAGLSGLTGDSATVDQGVAAHAGTQ